MKKVDLLWDIMVIPALQVRLLARILYMLIVIVVAGMSLGVASVAYPSVFIGCELFSAKV